MQTSYAPQTPERARLVQAVADLESNAPYTVHPNVNGADVCIILITIPGKRRMLTDHTGRQRSHSSATEPFPAQISISKVFPGQPETGIRRGGGRSACENSLVKDIAA